MNKKAKYTLAIVIGTLALAMTTRAQSSGNYQVNWSTIAGGGGSITGGLYSVSGTIGQADAGAMFGGTYAVSSGFWSALSVLQTTNAPLLSIHLSAINTATISWPSPSTGFALEENSDMRTINWTRVTQTPSDNGVTRSVIVPATSARRFYRLKN